MLRGGPEAGLLSPFTPGSSPPLLRGCHGDARLAAVRLPLVTRRRAATAAGAATAAPRITAAAALLEEAGKELLLLGCPVDEHEVVEEAAENRGDGDRLVEDVLTRLVERALADAQEGDDQWLERHGFGRRPSRGDGEGRYGNIRGAWELLERDHVASMAWHGTYTGADGRVSPAGGSGCGGRRADLLG